MGSSGLRLATSFGASRAAAAGMALYRAMKLPLA
ncbi:hypothetical protein M7I_3322 [Glarea lozoyensis 74030]|uniref:Uncharacterized protein n=1 Tax=Glarea lozoyensis (strain ATCC 74030 / MF5533) TaxID=1104152 RepID=H0EL63_GLAL7|nr:hypothetical protein M7I_3322 [Glarea lozoyensis 74030]